MLSGCKVSIWTFETSSGMRIAPLTMPLWNMGITEKAASRQTIPVFVVVSRLNYVYLFCKIGMLLLIKHHASYSLGIRTFYFLLPVALEMLVLDLLQLWTGVDR